MDLFSFEELDVQEEQNQRIHETPLREQIKDLEHHPIPNRALINYDNYQDYIGISMVKNTIVMQATRGCPYTCAYCHKIWPKSHIRRPAEHIFHEMKMYYDIGYRRFAFVDDIFNLDKVNSSKFFQMILDSNMKVHIFFPNGMRGDILTKEYIDLMVKAGVVELPLALETATPRLQKLIGKHLNIDRLKENLEYISSTYPHVILELFTIHGIPTETEEEAYNTYNFINSIKWLHFPYINILRLYPGTELAKIAMEHGITLEQIEEATSLAFHEIPDTIPFSKGFTRTYQSKLLYGYILNKERLKKVIPLERKIMTEDEMVQKYNSYFPFEVKDFDFILETAGLTREDLNEGEYVDDSWGYVEHPHEKMAKMFTVPEPQKGALRVLFLDLSQFFTDENNNKLYDLVETPLGHMYLLTYLYEKLGGAIEGKILKSRIDFNSYEAMKEEITSYKPDVIGIRTLTYHKEFFKESVRFIRKMGYDKIIIAGGPYATSSYEELLQENDVDIVSRGEGEITTYELMKAIIEHDKKLPEKEVLERIKGIVYQED